MTFGPSLEITVTCKLPSPLVAESLRLLHAPLSLAPAVKTAAATYLGYNWLTEASLLLELLVLLDAER